LVGILMRGSERKSIALPKLRAWQEPCFFRTL
jgi:hypothetical protein